MIELELTRAKITNITKELLTLFAKRQLLMQEIAEAKKSINNISIYDPFRESSLYFLARQISLQIGCDVSDLELFLSFVMGLAKHSQTKILHLDTQFDKTYPDLDFLYKNLNILTEKICQYYDIHSNSVVRRTHISRELLLMKNDLSDLPSGANILHLGCATGIRVSDFCNNNNLNLIGIDISLDMINKANSTYPKHFWINHDLRKGIPLDNCSIDYVIAPLGSASECFSDIFLKEIYRVMKPTKKCFLSFYNQQMLCGNSWISPWRTDYSVILNTFNDTMIIPFQDTLFQIYAKFLPSDLDILEEYNVVHVESSSPLWDDKPGIFFENELAIRQIQDLEGATAKYKPFLGKYIRCVIQK